MYGIYIHIPFCVRKCPYCDFYSVAVEDELRKRFLSALKNEILSFGPVDADTIYLGGGTPSLLKPQEISDILEILRSHNRLSDDIEISMECNPASVTKSELKEFRSAGINRLSIGCQSFQQDLLAHLGRLHSAEESKRTVYDAQESGFSNISVDIMLGIPYATVETTKKDAEVAASLGIQHVSAYLLKICEGTPFAAGVPGVPSDDEQADCYRAFCEVMDASSLYQYEISNFALPGFECKHNLKYWNCGEWQGFGPAAHMSNGEKRFSFPNDLSSFLASFESEIPSHPTSSFTIEGTVDAEEYIIMGLRKSSGISRADLRNKFNRSFSKEQEKFLLECQKHGLVDLDKDTVRLTREGFLLSNSILSEIME
ncbi:MAG: radical SAM family heme chaperone HemW [Oscillospiraceae bacterium]|nr:radical SAM family heme chaperone HemW [Oscillospiraceae bacterium]